MHRNVALGFTAWITLVCVANGCEINPLFPPEHVPTYSLSSEAGGASGSGGAGGMSCVCEDDGNECTFDLAGPCPGGEPALCHVTNVSASCSLGVGYSCNEKAECVDCLTCTDANCKDRCNGVACDPEGSGNPQCASGICQQGACCNAPCYGPCNSCNRPGTEGTCTRMPLGLSCGAGFGCNSAGSCVSLAKAPLGTLCTVGGDCMSGVCRGQVCRSQNGEPCAEDIECASGLCDPVSKTCRNCSEIDAACPSGAKCSTTTGTGLCQVFAGQPADDDSECVKPAIRSATSQLMCKFPAGVVCTRHAECQSNLCNGGICATNCSTNVQCPTGVCHPNGSCKLSTGERCVVGDWCLSGVCGGFPRQCQATGMP